MKKQRLDSEATAKYDEVCSQWARKEQVAMETAGIALPNRFSKYNATKEDAWEPALNSVIPGKFMELNKMAFNLRKNA